MISSIASLVPVVSEAGRRARDAHRKLRFSDRTFKEDGTVLTAIDVETDRFLYREISAGFPQANLLTEETAHRFDPRKPYTFAVDPIDGTDVFSQGMPSWAVSVGLLDGDLTPVAGIVYAPEWDALFFRDVDGPAFINGREISPFPPAPLDQNSGVMVYSNIHRDLDLRAYPGKIRNVGSTALHLCFPLIYGGIQGAILRRVHIWDLAGAHAINRALGLELAYLGGGNIDYSRLTEGGPAPDFILSGSPAFVRALRPLIRRYPKEHIQTG